MLKLEGRIVGPWTAELDRTWHSLDSSLAGKSLSVDLSGVSYIDHDGRGILADIYRKTRARFQTDTPLMEYFAQEARNGKGGKAEPMRTTRKRSVTNEGSLRF